MEVAQVMEWALFILFVAAVILLILSFKTGQSSKIEERIEHLSFSMTDEVYKLQQRILNLELDAEITAQEAGILAITSEKRVLLREAIDLHRRGYSFESIATKTQRSEDEIQQWLAPYIKTKDERSNTSNVL